MISLRRRGIAANLIAAMALQTKFMEVHAFTSLSLFTNLFSSAKQTLSRFQPDDVVVHRPHNNRKSSQPTAALILLPGCLVDPSQYDDLIVSIQDASNQNVWLAVPRLPFGIANPLVVPDAIQRSMAALRKAGYDGGKVFLGGHSLGGAFIPDNLKKWKDEVAGTVLIGCFAQRHGLSVDVPSLTLCGDLDGLVRASRIAESYHQNIIKRGDTDEQRLRNPVVLIEGMNHFQFLRGDPHPMKKLRDLEPETDDLTAQHAVAQTIANFLDVHQQQEVKDYCKLDSSSSKDGLIAKVTRTGEYLQPLIDAMELEGNYHLDKNIQGSPWVEKAQRDILQDLPIDQVRDEFHKSWYFNPFAKAPFFHPKVTDVHSLEGSDQQQVDLLTSSEAIYETLETILDTGFFSNIAIEIQSKFSSPQAVLDTMGHKAEYHPSQDAAQRINLKTIEWALKRAPPAVRRRYLERGIPLVADPDIPHNNGPSWICSRLKLQPEIRSDPITGKRYPVRSVKSHTLTTPLDCPVSYLGGKLYCKLLSPARVLEWMYTDALRDTAIDEWLAGYRFRTMNNPVAQNSGAV